MKRPAAQLCHIRYVDGVLLHRLHDGVDSLQYREKPGEHPNFSREKAVQVRGHMPQLVAHVVHQGVAAL